MPWEERNRMSLREEFVRLSQSKSIDFGDLCQRFKISRKTGYKWSKRYAQEGISGLRDLSKAPLEIPHKTPEILEKEVVRIRTKYRSWGGRKIKRRLINLGFVQVPAASTITDILHRYNLINQRTKKPHVFIRFEREQANDLWQMDFKGYFGLRNGRRCDPLTVLDDHSRYNLCLEACTGQTRESVQEVLESVFRHYGLPWQMTMDNGGPWGSHAQGEYTRLAVWLMKLGIQVSHSRPFHPQTQGKLERFHRTLKTDVLQFRTFDTHETCQRYFNKFRKLYNHERPHEALDYDVPAQHYHPSQRAFPKGLPQPEYSETDKVLKVRSQGSIYYRGKDYFIGKAFKGEYVAIKIKKSTRFDVFFGSHKIKEYS